MKTPKKQEVKPAAKAIAPVTAEDEIAKKSGKDERRRLGDQKGRQSTVTSQRSTILG